MPVTIGTQGKDDKTSENEFFVCPNCSRPFRHRSGFFNCRGCGGMVNIDYMKKHPEQFDKPQKTS